MPTSTEISSSSSSTTSNPSTNPLHLPLQNITNFIPIKLKERNFLLWKSLFLPVLRTFDLMKFIDGSSTCPPKFIQSPNPGTAATPIINPEYLTWVKTDQTLLIWLNATISEEVLPYVIGCEDSFSLWNNLETRLAHLSHSLILQTNSLSWISRPLTQEKIRSKLPVAITYQYPTSVHL
ncbi:hypothetical protein ACHQM5_014482 [Ranunculus cassubicifolius]